MSGKFKVGDDAIVDVGATPVDAIGLAVKITAIADEVMDEYDVEFVEDSPRTWDTQEWFRMNGWSTVFFHGYELTRPAPPNEKIAALEHRLALLEKQMESFEALMAEVIRSSSQGPNRQNERMG